MRPVSKTIYYIFATITGLMVLGGGVFLAITVFSLTDKGLASLNSEETPYEVCFFLIYSSIGLIFLIALAISAKKLFRLNYKGVSLLASVLKLELLYWLLMSLCWLLPPPFGRSAGGATGIGNMALSPQVFIAYPITGLIAIWLLKKTKLMETATDAEGNEA